MGTLHSEKITPGDWENEGPLTEHAGGLEIHGDGVWIGSIHRDHYTPGQRLSAGFPGNTEAAANADAVTALPQLLKALEKIADTTGKGDDTGAMGAAKVAQEALDCIGRKKEVPDAE